MASLTAFSGETPCVKCGTGKPGTVWHASDLRCPRPYAGVTGEHMCRTCENCGYSWPEAIIDTPPAVREEAADA